MRLQEIPATECAFAVLEAPAGSRRDARRELLFQLESLLPMPLDEVHAVFAPIQGGQVIACACARELVAEHRAKAEMLVPESVPAWIGIDNQEPVRRRLNLLTGEMRPTSSVNRQELTAKLVSFVAIAATLLVVLGVHRRVGMLEDQQGQIESEIALMYSGALPSGSSPHAQPDAIRFATLLNQARSTRTGVSGAVQADLVHDLAEMFRQWPGVQGLQVQSLVMQPGLVRLLMSTAGNDSAVQVVGLLADLPGWQVESRSISAQSDGVNITMTLSQHTKGGAS